MALTLGSKLNLLRTHPTHRVLISANLYLAHRFPLNLIEGAMVAPIALKNAN